MRNTENLDFETIHLSINDIDLLNRKSVILIREDIIINILKNESRPLNCSNFILIEQNR